MNGNETVTCQLRPSDGREADREGGVGDAGEEEEEGPPRGMVKRWR